MFSGYLQKQSVVFSIKVRKNFKYLQEHLDWKNIWTFFEAKSWPNKQSYGGMHTVEDFCGETTRFLFLQLTGKKNIKPTFSFA